MADPKLSPRKNVRQTVMACRTFSFRSVALFRDLLARVHHVLGTQDLVELLLVHELVLEYQVVDAFPLCRASLASIVEVS